MRFEILLTPLLGFKWLICLRLEILGQAKEVNTSWSIVMQIQQEQRGNLYGLVFLFLCNDRCAHCIFIPKQLADFLQFPLGQRSFFKEMGLGRSDRNRHGKLAQLNNFLDVVLFGCHWLLEEQLRGSLFIEDRKQRPILFFEWCGNAAVQVFTSFSLAMEHVQKVVSLLFHSYPAVFNKTKDIFWRTSSFSGCATTNNSKSRQRLPRSTWRTNWRTKTWDRTHFSNVQSSQGPSSRKAVTKSYDKRPSGIEVRIWNSKIIDSSRI